MCCSLGVHHAAMFTAALTRSLYDVADDQDGVVTRSQLLAGGMTQAQIVAHVDGRRWRQLNEVVVVLHNSALTQRQQDWAVLLSAPDPSALGGLSAARDWGLRGFAPEVVHVLVERGAKLLELPGVRVHVHESRRFSADDIRVATGLRRVGPARAVLDAASWTRPPQQSARILVAGVQQRLVTPRQLHDELQRAGAIRHRRLLRLLLDDLEGGAQALSEVELLAFCRRNHFPKPRLNVRVAAQGRRRYLDAEFPCTDGRLERVEIDGGVHLSLAQRWLDDIRDNDLYLAGRGGGLRFPSVAIYTDDPRAIRQLRLALQPR